MTKAQKENLVYELNFRWRCIKMAADECDERQEVVERCYYDGLTKAIELMGYGWERLKSGKHIIYS